MLGKSATTGLTVLDTTVAALTISPAAPALIKGATQQLTATATYGSGAAQDVTGTAQWQAADVSGSGVAVVGATGLVTGRSGGTATITASYGGKSGSVPLSGSGSTQPAPVLRAISPALGPSAGASP